LNQLLKGNPWSQILKCPSTDAEKRKNVCEDEAEL